MTEQDTEFAGIVEHLSNPLLTKKASFVGVLTGIMFFTWVLLMPAVLWVVYGWAFG